MVISGWGRHRIANKMILGGPRFPTIGSQAHSLTRGAPATQFQSIDYPDIFETPRHPNGAEPQLEAAEPRREAAEPRREAAEPRREAAEPRREAAEPRWEATEPRREPFVLVFGTIFGLNVVS
jgi:hypothetical protein